MLAIEIPRDVLALRIAQGCIGLVPPAGSNAGAILDDMDASFASDPGMPAMGAGFRRAADLAVIYLHECINAGKAPH